MGKKRGLESNSRIFIPHRIKVRNRKFFLTADTTKEGHYTDKVIVFVAFSLQETVWFSLKRVTESSFHGFQQFLSKIKTVNNGILECCKIQVSDTDDFKDMLRCFQFEVCLILVL